MSKLKIILFLSVFLTFCKKKQQIPGNIIPPAKMKLVLWDAMKADEIVNYYRLKDTSYGGLSKHEELYKTVYQIHHISKEDFTCLIYRFLIINSIKKRDNFIQKLNITNIITKLQ